MFVAAAVGWGAFGFMVWREKGLGKKDVGVYVPVGEAGGGGGEEEEEGGGGGSSRRPQRPPAAAAGSAAGVHGRL